MCAYGGEEGRDRHEDLSAAACEYESLVYSFPQAQFMTVIQQLETLTACVQNMTTVYVKVVV